MPLCVLAVLFVVVVYVFVCVGIGVVRVVVFIDGAGVCIVGTWVMWLVLLLSLVVL